ncbi:MAG: HPr family phosphocarrier protein [Clostridiales bacterium]|nr:HPr family phosphocarrier protein [Clostridiales bacterium]
MKSATIRLSSIESVRNFVDVVRKYNMDIDLSSGRYLVDAKSIMGIFSLDLMNPIKLTAHSDDCTELFDELKEYVIETE